METRGYVKSLETRVIFRKDPEYHNEVVAVFPEYPGTNEIKTCLCYTEIGQHSACSYDWYLSTKPATPEEYAPLLAELLRIGYSNITIRHKWTQKMDRERENALQF